ncbi:hypothetical protein, partial [Bradyrhizobium sp.]|uniref:hypothetical protein n=1 Tax=Bradyrhizobium sp. TaxID=376 RepID=UPI003C768946
EEIPCQKSRRIEAELRVSRGRAHSTLVVGGGKARYYGANATSDLAEHNLFRRDETQQPDAMRPEKASR